MWMGLWGQRAVGIYSVVVSLFHSACHGRNGFPPGAGPFCLGSVDLWGRVILCCGGVLWPGVLRTSWSLDASSILPILVTPKMFPAGQMSPREMGKTPPPVENSIPATLCSLLPCTALPPLTGVKPGPGGEVLTGPWNAGRLVTSGPTCVGCVASGWQYDLLCTFLLGVINERSLLLNLSNT